MIIIFKKEDGAVLVLSIIIIAVLMILITALAGSINSNISFTKRHENDVKAFYAAEAGIEKGINMIINGSFSSLEEDKKIEVITKENLNNNLYYNLKVKKNGNIYNLYSTGSGQIDKVINTTISYNNIGGDTLQAGESINLESKNFLSDVDSYNIVDGIPILNKEDFSEFKNEFDDSKVTEINEDLIIDKKNKDPINLSEIIENNKLLYIDGNFEISDKIDNIEGTEGSPFNILVTGDVDLSGIRNISNVNFYILGDFNYYNPPANQTFNNIFIYTAKDLWLANKDKLSQGSGAITIQPGFEFKGMVIAKENIYIYTKSGKISKSEIINLPDWFKESMSLTSSKIDVKSWEER